MERYRALLLATALAALTVSVGCRTNPVTGQAEFNIVSAEQEILLGHRNHPNIVFMYDGEYHDQELNRYLGTMVMRLHAVSHRPQMPMEFTMLNTSVINAFATPAHVYATRGFLAELENEAQFAAVMGHELSHVTAGHSAKRLSNQMAVSLVLGMADYAAGESGIARAALGAGEVGVTLLGLSYSREQERQADRVGTYYMALAGWHPEQSITMQRLLESLNERRETALDRYLSTHPGAGDRIGEIRAVIAEKDLDSPRYVQGDGVFADRWKGRLERLRRVDRAFGPYDKGEEALREERYGDALAGAEESIQIRDDQAPFHRLKGDALLGLGRIDDARAAYRASLERDPRYVLANIGLGRAYLAEGDHAAAEREFEKAAHDFPGATLPRAGLGLARYHQGQYAAAVGPLQQAARALPGQPTLRYRLAECYERTGRPALALQAYNAALETGLSGEERSRAVQRAHALRSTGP